MSRVAETKCPACGAPMAFDPAIGMLSCSFCGTTVKVGKKADIKISKEDAEKLLEKEETVQGFSFAEYQGKVIDKDAEPLPVYNCKSCGAEILSDWEQMSLTCPYCGNNVVLTDKLSGSLRPDAVVPFKITSDQLPKALDEFYKDKKLISDDYFQKKKMGKVTGIYVPFWIFEGKLAGPVHYSASQSTSYRSGDYIITKTDHYDLLRDISLQIKGLPVDAGKDFDDAIMDSLEPFDLSEAKPFDKAYLAGFAADRFDQNAQDIEDRARKRMMATAYAAARKTADGMTINHSTGSITANLDAKYVLLPVYLFKISASGKEYSYAVNGQTGKVVGQLPDDKAFKRKYYLTRFAASAAIPALFTVVKYFLVR